MEDSYQKWEYKIVPLGTFHGVDFGSLGNEGWELVAVYDDKLFFKRPVGAAPVSRLMPWENDPISVVRAELDKWDSDSFCHKQGYAARFSNACSFLGIETVGQLVKLGSYEYGKCRNVGKHHIQVVKDVLDELYGIENW